VAGAQSGAGASPEAVTPTSISLACPERTTPYPSPVAAMAQATLIRNDFNFVEGPLWIASEGVLWFSDTDFSTSANPNGPEVKIWRLAPPDRLDVVIASSGSNGLALANDGRVLAATHDTQSLSYFDPRTGERENRNLKYRGQAFNSPNDLAVRSDGIVYFTDPDYEIGPRASETRIFGVYRVSRRGSVSLLDGRVSRPNGIALSPDERTLYVGGHEDDLYRYALDDNGMVIGEREVFVSPGPSDGLTVDCAGNLYVTALSVQVFDPDGVKLGEIAAGEKATNVAFGGPSQTTLYITSQNELYSIELNVPGRSY
jgi:gluconolactonase